MNQRRKFIGSVIGLMSSSLLFAKPSPLENNLPKKRLGKMLREGAHIRLIAPGFALNQEKLQIALEGIKELGCTVSYNDRITSHYGYFSNPDAYRAQELNDAFSDPTVDAILCARGGYGCTRILDLINFENIKENPKPLIGFSDITALLNAIYLKTGLVGFHGPVGSTLNNSYSIDMLKNILFKPSAGWIISNSTSIPEEEIGNAEYDRYTIHTGVASGIAIGGSLTLIASMIGTDYEPDFRNKIVFLEDVGEKNYRIDRMLTQLLSSKTFSKAAGVVFGVFKDCDLQEDHPKSFRLKEVIKDRMSELKVPSAYGMSFGHVPENFTFPIGAKVAFNADLFQIKLLEAVAV